MNIGWAYRGLKPKAPLLAKDARNGAPSLFEGYVANGDAGHLPILPVQVWFKVSRQEKMGASCEAPKFLPPVVVTALCYCTVKVREVKCFTLPEVPITRTV